MTERSRTVLLAGTMALLIVVVAVSWRTAGALGALDAPGARPGGHAATAQL